MLSTGIVQLIQLDEEAEAMNRLGYPSYFMTILGVWKLLGVVAVLIPRFPLVKEWAYAGFFFSMTGAIVSHLAVSDPLTELFGPMLLLILTILSWYFRPANRSMVSTGSTTRITINGVNVSTPKPYQPSKQKRGFDRLNHRITINVVKRINRLNSINRLNRSVVATSSTTVLPGTV